MKRYEDFGLLLLRVGFSLLLLTHGYGKLMAFVGGNTALVGNPIGVGALISSILVLIGEVVAPVLILIGLKTRWAALASAITMGVAAFMAIPAMRWQKRKKPFCTLSVFWPSP